MHIKPNRIPKSGLPPYEQLTEDQRYLGRFDVVHKTEMSPGGAVSFEPQLKMACRDYIPGSGTLLVSGKKRDELHVLYEMTPRQIAYTMTTSDREGSAMNFDGVGWGGGTVYIVASGTKVGPKWEMIAPIRDLGAKVSPGTLASLTGTGNATDPIALAIGEATEELLVTASDTVLVPRFVKNSSFAPYNGIVASDAIRLSSAMALDSRIFSVSEGGILRPYQLNNVPIRLVLSYRTATKGERDAPNSVDIAIQPIIFNLLDNDEIGTIGYRDTLGIETGGRAPERDVAAIDIESTAVTVYNQGKAVDTYNTLRTFFGENKAIFLDQEHPFIPVMTGVMGVVASDQLLFRMARGESSGPWKNGKSPFLNYPQPRRDQ